MSIAHNIFLGRESTRTIAGLRLVDGGNMHQAADEALGKVRIAMRPSRTRARQLSGRQHQAVARARALRFGPRVVLSDEPTAALEPRETPAALGVLRDMADRGETVVLIGHKLPQMLELADNLLAMRAGRVVAACDPRATTSRDVTEFMVGSVD